MSSDHAAGPEPAAPLDSSSSPQQVVPQPDSPSKQDPRDTNASASLDGRSNDADKMLESGMVLDAEGGGGGAVDASGPRPAEAAAGEETPHWSEDDNHELKRVKVYELIGARWVDQGTAFCFGDIHENEAFLTARAEADLNQIILTTTIRSSDVYQRQQDTLIVWTEPDGVDYALSFQDPDGCQEVWNFIQDVQRQLHTVESSGFSSSPVMGSEPSLATTAILRSGHLPKPALGGIAEIEKAIKALSRTQALKERVCEYIQNEGYIKAIVEVFNQAEDLESIDNLHALCSCMQTILMLNDHTMYEHILDDDIFYGVVGMLEYDPEFPTHKANYREFLQNNSHFHQPVPIRDETIQKKVHHTYRLQFLKDVVLARAIDDSTFNVLNSCILFNQIDIINHVQNDQAFLREVVGIFLDEDMVRNMVFKGKDVEKKDSDKMDVDPPEGKPSGSSVNGAAKRQPSEAELQKRREVLLLTQQLCAMGKNVQLPARMALFRTLTDRGILFSVQWALGQPEKEEQGLQMICAAGEILTALLDHDLNGVRSHILRQKTLKKDDTGAQVEGETVLSVMCRVLVRSRDLAVQSQLAESLRVLLEISTDPMEPHPSAFGMKALSRPKDDPQTEEFLDYFYKTCIEVLFKPFFDLPEFKTLTDTILPLSRERTNLYLHLCELLANFATQHSFRSHFYMRSSNLIARVASLLRAKDKHLRLAAFRYFRALLRLNNQNLYDHLIALEVMQPILTLTLQESRRDNLLSSATQEFFEHIRKENVQKLLNNCMTKHEAKVRELSESSLVGPLFKAFIRRWEMNEDSKAQKEGQKPADDSPSSWNQARRREAEEESYFNGDDDDEPVGLGLFQGNGSSRGSLKRKRPRGSSIPPLRPQQALARAPALGSLMAYGDDNELDTVDDALPTTPPVEGTPSAPRPQHRQIVLAQASGPDAPDEDPEDALLESLVSPGPPSPSLTGTPPELGSLKRRREDDDDELLERLANKSKKGSASASPAQDKPSAAAAAAKLSSSDAASPASPSPAQKTGPLKGNGGGAAGGGLTIKLGAAKADAEGNGPKKIKLKLAGPTPASPTPAPSSPGVKDGDTG